MKRINSLTYLEGNTTIVFTKVPLLDGEVAQKFSFSVVGNDDLTEKLLKATKTHRIKEENTWRCAIALFAIIKEGKFTEITKGDEVTATYQKFEEAFSERAEFTMVDNSRPSKPSFTATLTNEFCKELAVSGTSRTKQDARVQAINKLLERSHVKM